MRFSSLLRVSLCASTLALTSLTACKTAFVSGIGEGGSGGVSTGGGGSGGQGGDGVSTGGGGSGGYEQVSDVIAIRHGDVSGASMIVADPDDVELIFNSTMIACSDPLESSCGGWRVTLVLPPASYTPGIVDLSTLTVYSSLKETEQPPGSGQCGGGYGQGPASGTLEIHTLDAVEVTFTITGLDVSFGGLDVNGDHTAVNCPPK